MENPGRLRLVRLGQEAKIRGKLRVPTRVAEYTGTPALWEELRLVCADTARSSVWSFVLLQTGKCAKKSGNHKKHKSRACAACKKKGNTASDLLGGN